MSRCSTRRPSDKTRERRRNMPEGTKRNRTRHERIELADIIRGTGGDQVFSKLLLDTTADRFCEKPLYGRSATLSAETVREMYSKKMLAFDNAEALKTCQDAVIRMIGIDIIDENKVKDDDVADVDTAPDIVSNDGDGNDGVVVSDETDSSDDDIADVDDEDDVDDTVDDDSDVLDAEGTPERKQHFTAISPGSAKILKQQLKEFGIVGNNDDDTDDAESDAADESMHGDDDAPVTIDASKDDDGNIVDVDVDEPEPDEPTVDQTASMAAQIIDKTVPHIEDDAHADSGVATDAADAVDAGDIDKKTDDKHDEEDVPEMQERNETNDSVPSNDAPHNESILNAPMPPVQQPSPDTTADSQPQQTEQPTMPTSDVQGNVNGGAYSNQPWSTPYAYQQSDAHQTAQQPPVPTMEFSKPKKQRTGLKSFGFGCLGAAVVCGLALGGTIFLANTTDLLDGMFGGGTTIVTQQSPSGTDADIPEEGNTAQQVADKVLPSVVSITTSSDSSTNTGSGCVMDEEGHIITNYHVIEGADELVVSMNGENYDATVVGYDDSSDLAVIKIDCDKDKLTPITFGDSDKLDIGEFVMAAGSPFGNEQSVSVGIISSLNRSTAMSSISGTTIYADLIQTDAAINPGNSGGALVDGNGNLIGICSLIESYSGSSSGVGFAIPSNYAIDIATQIIESGKAVHPYLGATVSTVDPITAFQRGLKATSGALVQSVDANTAADEAGLQEDDVITAVDDEEVTSADGLIITLRKHAVGDEVTLTVMRGDKEMDVKVKLGSDEERQEAEKKQEEQQQRGDTVLRNDSGNGSSGLNGYNFDLDTLRDMLNGLGR